LVPLLTLSRPEKVNRNLHCKKKQFFPSGIPSARAEVGPKYQYDGKINPFPAAWMFGPASIGRFFNSVRDLNLHAASSPLAG
jgi:hypothetical protein